MKQKSQIENLSDNDLAFLVKEGDSMAFQVLSDRYIAVLHGRAGRYASVVGIDVEDFVQEGMLALFRATKNYDANGGARFGTYAMTCINNAMTDAIRAHMKNLRQSSQVSIDDLDRRHVTAIQYDSLIHPAESAYTERDTDDMRTQQIETLLSDFEQQVLKLYLRGHTYQQISSILSTATKAVDNALQRVRKKLRPEI